MIKALVKETSKQTYWIIFFILLLKVFIYHPEAKAQKLTTVKIELKWFHQFQFAGIYMAKEKGYYQNAGLEVEILERDIHSNPMSDVLNGKVQFGITDSTIIKKRLEGDKLIILAAIYQHSPLVLISLAKNKFYSPLELKGKRIMYQKNIDDAMIIGMFANSGMSKKDFIFIPHNFKDDALLSGDVDAMSAYLGNQTYFYQKKGLRLNVIDAANYGIDLYGDMLFTSEKYFKENQDIALKFRKATLKGWKYALENPQESAKVIFNQYSKKKPIDALLHEAKHINNMIAPNFIELGHFNQSRINRIKNIYKKWNPSLIDNTIEGILFTEHIKKPYQINYYIIVSIIIFALALTVFSILFAIKWKTRELATSHKLNRATRKLENFQDVILQKFDCTRTTASSEINFMSDSMLDNLGYDKNEVIGQLKVNLFVSENPEAFYQMIIKGVESHGFWQGSFKLKAKDNSIRIYDCLVDEYIDAKGHNKGYISVHIDHTDKAKAEKLAKTDLLTNLANRYLINEKLNEEIERANRYQTPFSIILIDIDHFKIINDEHGHLIGDKVLTQMGKSLTHNTRAIDLVGRWGGEEFIVICPE